MRPRRVPKRMCVGCREMRPKKDLLRVVRSPDGEVALDLTGKKSGRGAYICPDLACFDIALRKGLLSKALEARIDEQVADQLRAAVIAQQKK